MITSQETLTNRDPCNLNANDHLTMEVIVKQYPRLITK